MATITLQSPDVVTTVRHAERAALGECAEVVAFQPTADSTSTTAIPAFVSQIFASGTQTVQVSGGSVQTLGASQWYYYVSNATSGNGMSLLQAVKTLLQASLGGVVWTVVVNKVLGVYRLQISHDALSSKDVTFSAGFGLQLGFADVSFTVDSAETITADYPSVWWWTPDMPISITGPELFDPAINYGVPESAGATQRAPDMTTAYVHNGEQTNAEFIFRACGPYYIVRTHADFPNRSFETWWRNGPSLGRQFLMWRNRDNATNDETPLPGDSSPFRYIEYGPQETLRSKLSARSITETTLVYWDVRLDCHVTNHGETPLA